MSDLEGMMKDSALLEEVKTITFLQKNMKACQAEVSGKNRKLDERGVKITHPWLEQTFFMPAVSLKLLRKPCQSKHGGKGKKKIVQACRKCKVHSSNGDASLVHIARSHYIPDMCDNSLRGAEDLKN